jgi:GTP cyclohydrolase I
MTNIEEYAIDRKKKNIQGAWETILDNLKHDWRTDPNLMDTPGRIARSMVHERCIGINSFPECEKLLEIRFPTTYEGLVITSPITVSSLCPHHFENVSYTVCMGYIPNGFVVGLSKIGRVIKLFAQQPIIQEDYTRILTLIFSKCLRPHGLGVIVKGQHMCMIARGLELPGVYTTTSEMLGSFRNNASVKEEFMNLCKI